MDAWNLGRQACGRGANKGDLRLGAGLEDIIVSLGEADFGMRLLAAVNQVVYVDFLSVYQLDTQSAPCMFLSSSKKEIDVNADCFKSYRSNLYEYDRTFDSAKAVLAPGGLSMTYTHQSQFAPAHRDAIYRRHGIGDRLSIVCEDGDEGLFAANLYRYESHRTFGSSDVDAVAEFAGSVSICIKKHIAIGRQQWRFAQTQRRTLAVELGRICPRLTGRELAVCEGLLLGRTYDGIAADLGLSLTTVKTYRGRAFDKLGINFKSQLFAIASGLLPQNQNS
ncbi:MAG TPA: helix-turn-helix transcriptional regulator [Eoetvoesiella sp.]|uniref:helix-turn-helix transcriptional regulator n=1 Tax=Eoetvoesiella sp. TaxID=1966355 RepID=UPI002C02F45E|nr:helix-turn-helix transcriptional regulator [Eoetvoesiella sp.]HWK62726.1 helix-turn-helix transcriptional regulator [Eoetvoesiella sp.]